MKKLFFEDELDETVKNGLGALTDETRPPEQAAAGRAAFLARVEEARQSVSPGMNRRHIGWIASILVFFRSRKERSPMLTTIVTFITVLTMILGGGGITLAAAQSSMPDQALYSVKTWTEDVRYQLASTDQNRLELALAFTERRMEEIKTMLQSGTLPEQAVAVRYQAQVETALRLAAGLVDGEGLQALQQVQQRLMIQQQMMSQLQLGDPALQGALVQTQLMLQTHLQWAQQGAEDPAMLQKQIRNQQGPLEEAGGGQPWVEPSDSSTGGQSSGSGECLTCTPALDGSGSQNPWTSETPIPGSGYGPGPGTGDGTTCTPALDGSGSQNPWTSETPIPGSGYGPGPGTGGATSTTVATETLVPPTETMIQPSATQMGGGGSGSGSGSGSGTPTQGSGSGGGGSSRP